MTVCLIGLGSNLGDRAQTLRRAVTHIAAHQQVHAPHCSALYTNPPIGGPEGQEAFLNAVLRIETSLKPLELLAWLQALEDRQGRRRHERWAARTLDLDLLLLGQQIVETEQLQLPHPRMVYRRFVLEPACEVGADLIHPTVGWTLKRLLQHARETPNYLALTGVAGCGKRKLATRLAEQLPGRVFHLADEAAAVGTAGPSLPSLTGQLVNNEIEFLRARAAQLRRGAVELMRVPANWLVTDFWLGQSLVYARTVGSEPEREAVESEWRAEQQRVLRPKLLVFLDPESPGQEDGPSGGAEAVRPASDLERAGTGFREQLAPPTGVPVLRLDPGQEDWALQQVLAALEAMAGW